MNSHAERGNYKIEMSIAKPFVLFVSFVDNILSRYFSEIA